MKPQDPELERKRLAEEYSNMADAELEELAADCADLTDLARTALNNEIERRGLNFDLQVSQPAKDIIEDDELVTIRSFRDLPEALLAKGMLESAAIECFLENDNMVRLDWLISNALGNIKLQVKRNDAETALEILDQPVPDDAENEE
jgi:hypothetical protein